MPDYKVGRGKAGLQISGICWYLIPNTHPSGHHTVGLHYDYPPCAFQVINNHK